MRVLAISGSLREGSYNTALLRAAAETAPEGIEVELYEDLDSVPHYNQDRDTDNPPQAVAELREQINSADAVLFSTPEFNGTVPGALKDLVDWASRPYGHEAALHGKPVAVIGASVTDYGAVWAQDHLRKALGIAGARVIEAELPVARVAERLDDDGPVSDPETIESLGEIVEALVDHHRQLAIAA